MKCLSLLLSRRTLVVALLGAALTPAVFSGQGGQSPLTPPNSNAFGKSFEEWNVLQTQYAIELGLGGLDPDNSVKKVRLLPGSFDTPTPVFEIAMRPGTPFVAAPLFFFGELYDDLSEDDPAEFAPIIADIFANTRIVTKLDGKVVFDGTGADLAAFEFGPTYYEAAIPYAVPQPRDYRDAIAALWVMGIGSVYHPLPVGRHTLENRVDDFGFLFTYHITVTPK